MVRGKRVLDVGDEASSFLASEFARYARAWIVVGRSPPPAHPALPACVRIVPERFEAWAERPEPSEFDVILLACPSPSNPQDAACLQWCAPGPLVVFFGHAREDALCGSPGFWQEMRAFEVETDARDAWSRLVTMRRSSGGEEEEVHRRKLPRKGDRYRLAPSCRWPGKRSGERPPMVEIVRDWEKGGGKAKIVTTGEVFHLRRFDLGPKM